MTYRDMFGEILADHHEFPRNFGKLENPSQVEQGYNPLCGDKVSIAIKMNEDGSKIAQCNFDGEGCSICMASASIMTEMVSGQSKEAALKLIEGFREKMQGAEVVEGLPGEDSSEDLVALYGIKRFPVRIKCALLAWTTLKKGIEGVSHAG